MLRILAAMSLFALPAMAQHHTPPQAHPHPHPHPQAQHRHHQHSAAAQPYAGLEQRRIKALSEEQTADLLAGRGMSLALAAELNGYPGPMHVLEHAAALRLTPAQAREAEALRDMMATEAKAIGARVVALEGELDALFASDEADTARLAALTAALGGLNGRLREVHLAVHSAMRAALSAEQRAAYARQRGYQPR
jgi:Spy/CpxP family protein refolding chaperone